MQINRLTDLMWLCDVQSSIRCEDTDPPSADPPTPAPTPDPPPAPVGDPPPPAAAAPEPEPAPPAAPREDWRDRRIAQLTAQLREAQKAQVPSPTAGLTEAQINERVQAEAQRLTAQQQFDSKAADVQAAGRTAHPDFDSTVNQFKRVVNFQNPAEAVAYNQFLQAAFRLGTDGAVKVIHDLGSDLNEAARILALSPVEMGVELGRRAGGAAADDVSRVPKPPKPADRRGAATNNDETDPDDTERGDKLSTREWMRRRNLQVEARRKEGVRMN